jgi:NADP-dependent 3-hydroxy acid dehydrogenase YdfG
VRNFAKAGAKGIAICARKIEPLQGLATEIGETYPGTEIIAVRVNVASESDVKGAFTKAVAKFGRIDTVISNAGAQTETVKIGETASEKWWGDFVCLKTKHRFCFLADLTVGSERSWSILHLKIIQ